MRAGVFEKLVFLKLVSKGKKFRLDCGHLCTPFHPWTNTAVFMADGRVICHNCYL